MGKETYIPRRRFGKDLGINAASLSDACDRAAHADEDQSYWPRTPGSSDSGDPYGSMVKPKGVPVWSKKPSGDAEWAIYDGLHIHSESNPLGLHTHIIGGTMSGGHSHGPQNRFGLHHHKKEKINFGADIDGTHVHDGANHPDGKHGHRPENFG
jgi:hypothetical protein